MGEGIRIRHKTLKGPCTVAVRDLTERIDPPFPGCSVCGIGEPGHEGFKTRHVTLDAEGCGIVSEGVMEGLAHLADQGGFDVENVVRNPPRQLVSLGANGATVTVHQTIPRDLGGNG